MFSLRRLAVQASRARPSALTPSTFSASRLARPRNLAELRTFESLLQLRWNSDASAGGDGYGSSRGGNDFRPTYNNNRSLEPAPPGPVIYVGNLPYSYDGKALAEAFMQFGEIKAAKVIYDFRGMSKGFGYVEFGNESDATAAVEKMHNAPLEDRPLSVQYSSRSKKLAPRAPTSSLFIGNMSYTMSDDDLHELFKDVKNCIDIRVAMDKRTNQPRGFAHADFVDVESAIAAREKLENATVGGRRLRIDFAERSPNAVTQPNTGNIKPRGDAFWTAEKPASS